MTTHATALTDVAPAPIRSVAPAPSRAVALAVALALTLAGCTADDPLPDRPPEVTGVVADADAEPTLAAPSDPYYEGMDLLRGDPVLVARNGSDLTPADLDDGDPVEVWVAGPCAESFPVQCEIEALRVGP